MEILTGAQMQTVDRVAIDRLGIPSLILMEAAGAGIAQSLLRDWPDAVAGGVVVLCGKGNNGGDGLVVARHLARRNQRVRAILLFPSSSMSADAAIQVKAAEASGVELIELPPSGWDDRGLEALRSGRLIVDGMLGTGISGGARGRVAESLRLLESGSAPIVAIDMPSGMDSDDRGFDGASVCADATYTLCRPKPALLARRQQERIGRLTVVPIGIPQQAVDAAGSRERWLRPAEMSLLLPRRKPETHKGSYGHLLLVAGNTGTCGAAVLAASAALRSGVGLLTVAGHEGALSTLRQAGPEWMTAPFEEWASLASTRDAVALGPGLGTEPSTVRRVVEGLAALAKPAVIDADGLNAFPAAEGWHAPDDGERVVTPHPAEAARLLGCSTAEVQADRPQAASRLAERLGCVAILKGDRSWIAAPDGRRALNTTGNPGMATGGSGDVLTGMVGSFLARGLSAWNSACLGAYLHGSAGDRLAERLGPESLSAGQLPDAIPCAVRGLQWDGGAEPW